MPEVLFSTGMRISNCKLKEEILTAREDFYYG